MMGDSRKRVAEEAFVEEAFTPTKSKKRRSRKSRDNSKIEDGGETTDIPFQEFDEDSVLPAEKNAAELFQKADCISLPAVNRRDISPNNTNRNGIRSPRIRKKKNKNNRPEVNYIGSHAVVRADSKRSPKKHTIPLWELSQARGGTFIDQDPILTDGDEFLILPTATSIQIYSGKTSLHIRTLQISEDDPITSCVVDPSNPHVLFISRMGGIVQKWNWSTGERSGQWSCQKNLRQILEVISDIEDPDHYALLTAHGILGEKARLLRSILAPESSIPNEELLLQSRKGYWQACKSVDNGNIVLLCSGRRMTIGYLQPNSKGSESTGYTWRETTVPQYITSMDIQVGNRPKLATHIPMKMINVVIGCNNGVILVYEDLLYRLIGREKRVRGIEVLTRRLHWHREAVNTVKWSNDGNYLVSGGNETVLVIWQLDTNQQQFLPHLSTPVLNLSVSATGSSYTMRLADSSVMVLKTADLLPSVDISCLALKENSTPQSVAAINPNDPHKLLVATHADPLTPGYSSATMLRSCDVYTARQISRQALARNMTTARRINADGGKVHEPNIIHLSISHNGEWLITVDEWRPRSEDLPSTFLSKDERSQDAETCLRFWKWQEEVMSWELVTRVDEPHSEGEKSVLDLAVHPSRLEASTVGSDGILRKWNPMARHRDGVAVKDKSGKAIYTWICSKKTKLEPSTTINRVDISGALAYSEDGSVIAASWSRPGTVEPAVHFFDTLTEKVMFTQVNIVSSGPAQLAFSGRFLLALSSDFCVWDMVTLRKAYGITLRHNSRDGKFLAVNSTDSTFALSFDSRTAGVPSRIAIYHTKDPRRGPLHQGKVHGHVRILLPNIGSPGYIIVDSQSRIRNLVPPDPTTTSSDMITTEIDHATKGLLDIFGGPPATGEAATSDPALEIETAPLEPEERVGLRSLEGIMSSIASSKLPTVQQMFEQVANLFAKRPAAATS